MPELLAAPVLDPLAAEADHRVANNLSILSSLIRLHVAEAARSKTPFSPAEVSALLEELSLKVEAVAKIHKVLAGATHGQLVDLDRFMGGICSAHGALYGSRRAFLTVNFACGESIPSKTALYVGLALSETLTNAVKYAHPTGIPVAIHVRSATTNGEICLEVSDDGVGLPEGFDAVKDGGMGFRLMRAIAKQIEGKLVVASDSLGTTCKLVFPTPHDSPIARTQKFTGGK